MKRIGWICYSPVDGMRTGTFSKTRRGSTRDCVQSHSRYIFRVSVGTGLKEVDYDATWKSLSKEGWKCVRVYVDD